MWGVLLALVPWLVLLGALPVLLRRRPELGEYPGAEPSEAPMVSIILPTRDDAHRVGLTLSTLLATSYPSFEVIVVDGGSGDGTREIVEALEGRAQSRIRLLQAVPAPADWPWRAWACWRGCREARGHLLLFTDTGTTHAPELLHRAVGALEAEGADLLTVYPRVIMEGFWERLVMPHVRLLLSARFPSAERVNRSRNPRDAVASYPFMLFRREAYVEIGGHGVLREERSIEDLAIAQAVVASGRKLVLVHGEALLEIRVARRLGEITGGWTGAVPFATRSTVPPWIRWLVPWLLAVTPLVFFVAPPTALVVALLVAGRTAVTSWAGAATLTALVFWLVIYARYRIRPAYAIAYPVGALATSGILVRSIIRARLRKQPAAGAEAGSEGTEADDIRRLDRRQRG